MTQALPVVLITRPEAQAHEFALLLRGRIPPGTPILVSPVLEILTLPLAADLGRFRFLILTSANAVSALDPYPEAAALPAYCVGDRTAEKARARGMDAVASGATAQELIDALIRNRPAGPGLYLRGRHVSANIVERLNSAGIETESAVIYDQQIRPLTPEAEAAITHRGPVILPLFSARSAAALAEQIGDAAPNLRAIAMSEQVAEAWAGTGREAMVSASPTAHAMADAVAACLREGPAC